MQLNLTTDYAIRIVIYLSLKKEVVSSAEISEKMGISQNAVLKIIRQLKKAGITNTHIGIQGGFSITKSPKEISLLTIIQVMENTTKINRCLEEDKFCSRFATESCPVRNFYCTLQNELEAKLSSITVQDLLESTSS
ncbi:RrF2 family transcriptional regulator [Beduini massiliensis]|uniref:RrF2 family transcriptional regulator n=1 Tax=Beduini massiliensis TaxID=1585974 RepID=UPI00059A7B27|nr:Rrf2 family transcriptional regulator [Beduini massiliensis]